MKRGSSSDISQIPNSYQNAGKAVNGGLRLRILKKLANDPSSPLIVDFGRILADRARQLAEGEGIEYESLPIMNRMLMTRYLCPLCGPLPLFFLDIRYLNKTRCGKCSMIVALKNSSGKYGRIRKKIAINTCKSIDEILNCN